MASDQSYPDTAAPGTGETPAEGEAPRRSAAGRTVLLGVVLAFVAVVAIAAYSVLSADDGPSEVLFGPGGEPLQQGGLEAVSGAEHTPLPEADLEPFGDGGPVNPADYVGTPLVVNFWATWCPPCVEEMPDFEQVWRDHEGAVAFLGVNSQDREDAAVEFVDRLGITYDMATDRTGEYFAAVNGYGWPTTLLVDEDGNIRYRRTGPVDAEQLTELLVEHLGVAD